MIYFTADPHFGHANIVKMCGRPFEDIEEMNEALITAWNNRVSGNDTVYIVGDMFFRCEDAESILKRLKGKKRLIVGNHDGSWVGKVELGRFFISVDHYLEISDGAHALTLCHYPLLTWKHAKKFYMIHGHSLSKQQNNGILPKRSIRNQLQEDYSDDQISIKEYVDPFTGQPVQEGK